MKIRLYQHCSSEAYSGKEIHNGAKLLQQFARSKGSVKSLLGSADMAVLLASSDSSVGGVAYLGLLDNPVAMVTKRGAEAGFTFGHEVGHILGGDHDKLQVCLS